MRGFILFKEESVPFFFIEKNKTIPLKYEWLPQSRECPNFTISGGAEGPYRGASPCGGS